MTGVRQTILAGDPSGVPGNCLQAAVATLLELDLDVVPHFVRYANPDGTGDPDELWWYALHGFMATLQPAHRLVEERVDPRHPWLPDRPCLVTGKSPRGDFNHVVVYWGDGRWWDPHPSDDGIDSVISVQWVEPVEQAATLQAVA